jgi:hypothetical protein
MQIKLTKARCAFYLMNKDADSKVEFEFLDAQLLVNRVRPISAYLLAHNTTTGRGTRDLLLDESRTQDIHFLKRTAFLVYRQCRLWIHAETSLIHDGKITDFFGSVDANPFHFRHYEMNYFALYVNGKHIPSGGLHLDMGHEKASVMGYRTLFQA